MPTPNAVLKRWTWLLVAAAAGACALGSLTVLHHRERRARDAAAQAQAFAAGLRDGVRELRTVGLAVPHGQATRVLPPAVARATALQERRLARLDAALGDPGRTARLRAELHFLPRLAATTRSPRVVGARLDAAGAQIAAGADRIARAERARADRIASASLAAAALAVLLGLVLAGSVLRRVERRDALTAAGHRPAAAA